MASSPRRAFAPERAGRLRFGDFEYDPQRHELRKGGVRVRIQRQPLAILLTLLESPGSLVTREELRLRLWDSATFVAFEHGLNSAMKRLRDVLCDSADHPRFIETVLGEGYRFIGPVEKFTLGPAVNTEAAVTAISAIAPLSTWQRPGGRWLSVISVAGIAVVAIAFVAIRHFRHEPKSSLSFHARDWALVVQFENLTGDPIFDVTVEAAVARDLTNSQFVTVVPRERVNDTLALMRLPTSTSVNAAIGREVCLRDGGIRALIAGRIEKIGSAYLVSAQLFDPTSGRAVVSFEETADGQPAVLRAVHALSNDLRQALGQKLSEIQQSDAELQRVTTPSLKALQLYSQADEQIRDGNEPAASELLRHAIDEDPNFASAHLLSAWALRNQGKRPAEFMPYAKRALELSGQTSEAERYFIEGSYYEMTNEPDHAIAAYQALLRVNPAHFWGSNNLGQLLIPENRMQEVVDLSVHRADAEPNNFQANWDAGYSLVLISERLDLARPYVRRASELLTTMSDLERTKIAIDALWVQLYPAYEAWMRDDVALARAELERAERNPVARDGVTDPLMFGAFRQALGETHRAKAWLQQASGPMAKSSVGFAEVATLAFLCGDDVVARSWLQRMPRDRAPMGMSLLVREGMLRQADALAQKYSEWRPQFRNVAMGELLLAQGKTLNGTRLLRAGLDEQRDHAYPTYFLGADSLARAYERQGNFSVALEVLKNASADRARVYGPFKMSGATLWMQDQADLARLYRRVGRVNDAENIEDELRKLLTYADPDYPMLVELQRLQNNPSLTTNGN